MTMNGSSWTRDTVEFNCGDQIFVLKQKANVITGDFSEFRGRFCETSEILVRDVAPDDVPRTLAAIDRICWLLSFAGLSRVLCYGHDYPDGSACGTRHTVMGVADFFRPTLEIRDGTTIKSFVEQTYPTFVRLEKSRKLNVVIDYLLQAERQNQPTECRLIFAFVLLENLKDTYARKRGIPYIKGFFRKELRANGPKYSFEELLHLMFREVRMRRGLNRVIKLRNEIIHSGLSHKPHHQRWSMYEKVHDLLREYILRLLGYHGTYLVYSSASNAQAAV
jgi:hypothetical protein